MKTKHIISRCLLIISLFFLFPLRVEAKDTLAKRERKASQQIYECLFSFQDYVDISEHKIPYSQENATNLLDQALDCDLYLFNILSNISDFSSEDNFCSCYRKDGYIIAYAFDYKNFSSDTLTKQYETLQGKVKKIQKELHLSSLSPEWAVCEVHDYIALHTDYDPSKQPIRSRYSAYGALLEGKAVCSGYASACELLLESIGIPTKILTSDVMDHAWNAVKLGGHWYHMDITWDDPYIKKKNFVSYRYFLKTDQEFLTDSLHPHYGWNRTVRCTSKKYQKIPKKNSNSLFHRKNRWYLFCKNKKGKSYFKAYNFSFSQKKKLLYSQKKLKKFLQIP